MRRGQIRAEMEMLEALARSVHDRARGARRGADNPDTRPLLHRDDQPIIRLNWRLAHVASCAVALAEGEGQGVGSSVSGGPVLTLARLEYLDKCFRQGAGEECHRHIESALREIGKIPSGKRGSGAIRHPLCVRQSSGVPLPPYLVAGQAAYNAEALTRWLDQLRRTREDAFCWLVKKWLYATDAQQGLMRLDDHAEEVLAAGLGNGSSVIVKVEETPVAWGRQRRANPKRRARILVDGTDRQAVSRSAGPVRWVMTWVCALHLAGELGIRQPE